MKQAKRHHYVPKAYLKAFCDERGNVLVYRKEEPTQPLQLSPENTQVRRYYYSQPKPDGGRDNNSLEQLFSEVEAKWPATVERLQRRERVDERLDNIFEFIALQRVRVPAARDVTEAIHARTVIDTISLMQANGHLPPLPPGLENFPSGSEVSINPHQSIHGMAHMMQGMARLFSVIGFAVVHNSTATPFLTSDNPVLWFDPTLPLEKQRPYTVGRGGAIFLVFPISPTVAIIGSDEYKEHFSRYGLQHNDVKSESFVLAVNEQICRFAYDAVIAQRAGQEELIARYAETSPIHEAVALKVTSGAATIHRFAFGPRSAKPKWDD